MFVNLNSLNESLEKLYESKSSLTEAFDDSFPKWLKDRITTVKNYHKGGYKKVPYSQQPTYKDSRTGEDAHSSYSQKSLFQKSLTKGIDFTKTKVVEGPVPEKRTDPRLKEPNIPIWLFSNGQVYIEGVNEDEISKNFGKAFRYMSLKDKIADAVGFAYIDGSTLDPDSYKNKINDRERIKDDVIKAAKENPSAGVFRKGDPEKFYPDVVGSWYSRNLQRAEENGYLDKSGYPINPKRYEDALEKARAKKIFQNLKKTYDYLMDVREDITAASAYINPFEDEKSYNRLSTIMSTLVAAIKSYNRISTDVKDYTDRYNSGKMSEDDYQYWIKLLSKNLKDDYDISKLKKAGDDIFLAGVDWLE